MAKKTNKKQDKCAKSLGTRGGKKGGPARDKKLTSAKKSEIASQGGKAKAAKYGKAKKKSKQ